MGPWISNMAVNTMRHTICSLLISECCQCSASCAVRCDIFRGILLVQKMNRKTFARTESTPLTLTASLEWNIVSLHNLHTNWSRLPGILSAPRPLNCNLSDWLGLVLNIYQTENALHRGALWCLCANPHAEWQPLVLFKVRLIVVAFNCPRSCYT